MTRIIKKIKEIVNEIKRQIENKLNKDNNKIKHFDKSEENKLGKDINELLKLNEGFQTNPMFMTLRTCVKLFYSSRKLFDSHFSEVGNHA